MTDCTFCDATLQTRLVPGPKDGHVPETYCNCEGYANAHRVQQDGLLGQTTVIAEGSASLGAKGPIVLEDKLHRTGPAEVETEGYEVPNVQQEDEKDGDTSSNASSIGDYTDVRDTLRQEENAQVGSSIHDDPAEEPELPDEIDRDTIESPVAKIESPELVEEEEIEQPVVREGLVLGEKDPGPPQDVSGASDFSDWDSVTNPRREQE